MRESALPPEFFPNPHAIRGLNRQRESQLLALLRGSRSTPGVFFVSVHSKGLASAFCVSAESKGLTGNSGVKNLPGSDEKRARKLLITFVLCLETWSGTGSVDDP